MVTLSAGDRDGASPMATAPPPGLGPGSLPGCHARPLARGPQAYQYPSTAHSGSTPGRGASRISERSVRMSRDVVDFSGLRQDGRRANETRQVHCNGQSVALGHMGHMRACRCAASSASVQTRTVPLSSRSGTRRSLLPSLGRVRSVAIMPVLALQSRPAPPRLSGVQKGADAARPRHIDFPALSRVVRERAGGQ